MSTGRGEPRSKTVHSLANQPFLDVPNLRVEDRSSSALSTYSDTSPHTTPSAAVIPKWLVRPLLAFLVLSAVIVQLFGQSLLFKITEMVGFVILFVSTFILVTGVFYWWSVMFYKDTIDNDNSNITIMKLYGLCCLSEFIATVSNYVVDLGLLESSPIDIAFYFTFSLSLFSLFSSFIHRNGIASMFNQETTTFVGFVLISHFSLSSLFTGLLPSFIYSQIVYIGCLFGLSLSLLVVRYPKYFSLSTFRRLIVTRKSTSGKSGGPSTTQGGPGGRRFSTVSLASSIAPPRSSLTSQSSRGTSVVTGHSSTNLDVDALNEAHGILGDLLFQESSLTQKGKESLKHIQDMLGPRVTRTAQFNRSRIGSNVSDDDASTGSSIGVNPHIYGYKTSKTHRKSVRISQFTTTTTATGLPNVEVDPVERKRSVAPRVLKSRISLAEGRLSVHALPPNFSPRERFNSLTSPLASTYTSQESSETSDIENQHGEDTRQQPIAKPESPYLKLVKENGSVRRASDGTVLAKPNFRKISGATVRSTSFDNSPVIVEEDSTDGGVPTESEELATPLALNAPSFPGNKVALFNPLVVPSSDYSISDYQHSTIEVLEQVMDWDFPIFELEKVAGDHILSHMAYCLFLEAGLIDTFKIPQRQFINYFRILEANYGLGTYHNKTHAADVLHATAYLLFEEIPEFSFQLSRGGTEREWIGYQRKNAGTNLASAMTILEVFACYMGAAMHDFDHPGRTNAFLVATKNPLAVLYNDKSVLENHHAAASWDLLTSLPDNNFITDFDESELKRFRFLLIECILATDLKLHFDIVRSFKEKTEDGPGIDWSSEVERLEMMKMVIKMADINTPTKAFNLHRSWTLRITEEFFQQSDEEVALGLPQTIFMSRKDEEKLPAIQVSFIQNLVSPLFHACGEAGLIPGIIEDNKSTSRDTPPFISDTPTPPPPLDGTGSDTDMVDDDSIPDEALVPTVQRKIVSIILTNLQMNFEAWQNEIPKEEDTVSNTTEEEKEEETNDNN